MICVGRVGWMSKVSASVQVRDSREQTDQRHLLLLRLPIQLIVEVVCCQLHWPLTVAALQEEPVVPGRDAQLLLVPKVVWSPVTWADEERSLYCWNCAREEPYQHINYNRNYYSHKGHTTDCPGSIEFTSLPRIPLNLIRFTLPIIKKE